MCHLLLGGTEIEGGIGIETGTGTGGERGGLLLDGGQGIFSIQMTQKQFVRSGALHPCGISCAKE